jgi:hypothetical protein
MQRLKFWLAFCFPLLAACAAPPEPKPAAGNWISIETQPGPHCGRCDTTKLVIQENGLVDIEQGHWLFNHHFWQTSRRKVQIVPKTALAFRSHLENFRPQGTINLSFSEECETYRTHQERVRIRWQDASGEDELFADFGCRSEKHPVMRCDMIKAVELLGIENLHMREWEWADCD